MLTFDGRLFVGSLVAFDQSTNLVLNKCTEKVVHEDAPVEIVPLGLYLLRGDNMYGLFPQSAAQSAGLARIEHRFAAQNRGAVLTLTVDVGMQSCGGTS